LVFDFQFPTTSNSCKKECRGVEQDFSMNNNTTIITQRGKVSNTAKNLLPKIEE
jgi:hypothetical protein